MNATVKDLAVFIGYKLHPNELGQTAIDELDDAYGRLSTTHPEKLLDLLLTFHRSGMHPRQPAVSRVPISGKTEEKERGFARLTVRAVPNRTR